MKKFLEIIVNTATFRQSGITVAGTMLNGLLGALFYILVARIMGPEEFGLLTISIVTLTLVADMADIGTNTGLIRFVSSNLTYDQDKAMRFLKLTLEIKIAVWLVVFLIISFSAPVLAQEIFHKEQLILPLRLVAFGVGGALLFSFATSSLQAFQKYFLWSGINITTNLSRLALLVLLIYSLGVNIQSSLLVYIILPFFGFFMSLYFLPTRKILESKNELMLSRELFKYNIPVAIFTIISAFSSRLDTFLNAALLSAKEVGIYGAANQLVQVVPQLVTALGLVAAPKFSGFQNDGQMVIYFKKFQLFVSGIFLLGVLSIPIISYLIPVIYGKEYQQTIIPFIFLLLAMLVFLISVPVHSSVIFYFGRPDIFIGVAIGNLILTGGLGYIMISNFGIIGASITVLVGTAFNFIYPLIWLLIKLRR